MSPADKTLQCSDCGTSFTFSAEEQDFFATKGYTNEPKRCPACRQAKRAQRNGSGGGFGGSRSSRQMHSAVCAECGAETQVPFEPREGRPVYCSRCYDKVKPSNRR
ncbi:MAG: zinc-ribbon domain containing protein [Dehalococcoidia bacterium]|nr:zinc-ribbon domain containing protein [Dehalococcoidia bacterium]